MLNKTLKIGILNLMPNLVQTEEYFKQVLTNPFFNLEIDFIYLETLRNKKKYQKRKYKSFLEIKNISYDGIIITGAPLEHLEFKNISYNIELQEFLNYTKKYVKSTICICWSAEFALNYFYQVKRFKEPIKLSGLYEHILVKENALVRGFSKIFLVPQSRYYSINLKDVMKNKKLNLISKSRETGPFLIESKDKKIIFLTGHLEYQTNTLNKEYKRDLKKGLKPLKPKNYYLNGKPENRWQSEATLFFQNWLVYRILALKS